MLQEHRLFILNLKNKNLTTMICQANNITKLTYLKNKKVLLNESEIMDLETGEVMHKLEIKI